MNEGDAYFRVGTNRRIQPAKELKDKIQIIGVVAAFMAFGEPVVAAEYGAETNREVAWIRAGHSEIRALAFSPDGKWLASEGDDFTLKIWNCEEGSVHQIFPVERGWQARLLFSPDGKLVTRAGLLGVDMFNVPERRRDVRGISLNQRATGAEGAMIYSPDGSTLVAGFRANELQLSFFRAADRLWVKSHPAHRLSVASLAFTPDGKFLVSASADAQLKWWPIHDGEWLYPDHGPDQPWFEKGVKSSAGSTKSVSIPKTQNPMLSPDAAALALSTGKSIELLATVDGKPLRTLQSGVTRSMAFSPDAKLLYAAVTPPGDGTSFLKAWRVADGKESISARAAFNQMACSREWIAGVDLEGLKLLSASNATLVRTLTHHKGAVRSIACSPDGTFVASGGEDRKIRIWRASDGALIHTFTGHVAAVTAVGISPDGAMLVSGDQNGVVNYWDVANKQFRRTLIKESKPVQALAFSSRGDVLATLHQSALSVGATVRLWRASDGESVRTIQFTNNPASVAFSPDGEQMIFACRDGVRILRVADGTLVRSIEQWPSSRKGRKTFLRAANLVTACFSSDGSMFAAGSASGACIWRTDDGTPISHSTEGTSLVCFSRDDQCLFTAENTVANAAAYGSELRARRVATGERLWSLGRGPESDYTIGTACSFGPRQESLAIARRDGTVLFVRMHPPEVVSRK